MAVLKDLETFVVSTRDLRDAGIPSVSMAFLDDPLSRIQHHVMSRGDENAETVYQACSISKAITALAVAKLVDEGKLGYETKVIHHIPEPIIGAMVDDNTRHLLAHVTVGMLLSHRSGLSQHGFPGYVGEPAKYQDIFSGKPPSNTPRIRFHSLPGSQYSYSGGGFTLLQIVLEHIMWMPFADLLQQTVPTPLGMSRSRFGDTASGDNNYARAYFTAYTPGTSSPRGYHRFMELAAAGLWTTPTDLLKATAAIPRSLFSQNDFLTPGTARKMLTLAAPQRFEECNGHGMGLGRDILFALGRQSAGLHLFGPCINNPRLMSLAIMTNSTLGWPTIKKLVIAIFAFRAWPLYDSLPAGWKMSDFPPYAAPEGIDLGDKWRDFLGRWGASSSIPNSSTTSGPVSRQLTHPVTPDTPPGTFRLAKPLTIDDGEWEIYEDGGHPTLAYDGVAQAMRLKPGAAPWLRLDGNTEITFVVEGLELAIRMCTKIKDPSVHDAASFMQSGTGNVDMWIELVQEDVTILRRV